MDLVPELSVARAHLIWWLENYEQYIECLQGFHSWWTGKYRAEYNTIVKLLSQMIMRTWRKRWPSCRPS